MTRSRCRRGGRDVERDGIGVHDPVDAHLSGVEVVALHEGHGDRTVGLPALLADVIRQVAGEGLHGQRLVLGERRVVGAREGDGVAVGDQQVAVDHLEGGLRLLTQLRLHLGRHHPAAEESGERVAHGTLEGPFELADDSHAHSPLHPVGSHPVPGRVRSRRPRRHPVDHRGDGQRKHATNSQQARYQRIGMNGSARVNVFERYSGEWRNGRRAGFRCQCPSGRGGSSPPSPTAGQHPGPSIRRPGVLSYMRAFPAGAGALDPRLWHPSQGRPKRGIQMVQHATCPVGSPESSRETWHHPCPPRRTTPHRRTKPGTPSHPELLREL